MKLFCPVTMTKFVGTISLGLLTGVSYNLTSITLPSLALLPSASRASKTLSQIQQASTKQILTLASISSLCLVTSYTLASPRNKHPYLLWTALASLLGGQGVEYWYNGLSSIKGLRNTTVEKKSVIGEVKDGGYVEVEGHTEVNGEKVEAELAREKSVQGVRTLVAGVGFFMAVVGIWGDGA